MAKYFPSMKNRKQKLKEADQENKEQPTDQKPKLKFLDGPMFDVRKCPKDFLIVTTSKKRGSRGLTLFWGCLRPQGRLC